MVIAHIVHLYIPIKAPKSISSKAENIVSEITAGFPLYGLPVWVVIIGTCVLAAMAVAYSVAGKGTGSHAGREEVRRSYRRELARQMARQDAEKIKQGEKPRKKWMQW